MSIRALLPLLMFLAFGLAHEPALAAYEAAAEPGLHAQSRLQLAGFPAFEFQQLDGEPLILLGANAFTPQQLLQFVMSLPEFIDEASRLVPGQALSLRQAGVEGYVALSAHYDEPMNRFTLTFLAEAPAHVASVAAVRGLGLNLADMLLTRE